MAVANPDSPAARTLRIWMAERSLCVKILAAEINICPTIVSKWRSGKNKPSLRAAIKLDEISGGRVPASAWLPD